MIPKKILLLSVSSGAGHTRAAEALRSCTHPALSEMTLRHLDVMHFVTRFQRVLYTDFYVFLVKRAPLMWRCLYQHTNSAKPDGSLHRLRRWAERRGSKALLSEIAQFKPDIIICTHFLPAEILSQHIAEGGKQCPVWVQVTDFDLHRMWVHEHMTGYFAPNEEVAFRLRHSGVAAQAIHITGIPIMAAFSRPLDRAACARALGLDPEKMTLLLMGGGAGLGNMDTVAAHLLASQDDFQLIVLAAGNTESLTALHHLARRFPGRLAPQGYTDGIERLMACADLVVTKPGGLSASECLAMGLPMIVNAAIPGQEESNANFLLEQGAALKASDLVTLEYRIRHLLVHPEKLEDMRARSRALGRPHAAAHVIDTVLDRTEK